MGSDEYAWAVTRMWGVSDDDAVIIELENLCEAVEEADQRLTTAFELASDDDVDAARDTFTSADQAMRARVQELGAALYADGGDAKMRSILERVRPALRAMITTQWEHVQGWGGIR
jgi:hypothetical protein